MPNFIQRTNYFLYSLVRAMLRILFIGIISENNHNLLEDDWKPRLKPYDEENLFKNLTRDTSLFGLITMPSVLMVMVIALIFESLGNIIYIDFDRLSYLLFGDRNKRQ